MTIGLKYAAYLSTLVLLVSSCSKDDNEDGLENSTWFVTNTDKNPSTNPPGGFGYKGINQYFLWSECRMDDSFTFSKNQLFINDNGIACDNGLDVIFGTNNRTYSYNEETKELTISSGDGVALFNVYELNKDRLKLGIPIPTGARFGNMIFLFERK